MRPVLAFPAFLVAAFLACAPALALEAAPDAIIRDLTQEVVAAIREDAGSGKASAGRVAELVETRILPVFDFAHMAQIAVARNWRLATPEQQIVLTAEFRTLLVRTYSTALAGYRDQAFEFRPLRMQAGDTDVTVKSVVRQSGTAPLNMDYDMEKTAAGWKVYDIKIAGMSLVTTYRDAFAVKVRESGVDGLIQALMDKNRLGDGRFRSRPTGDFYLPVHYRG